MKIVKNLASLFSSSIQKYFLLSTAFLVLTKAGYATNQLEIEEDKYKNQYPIQLYDITKGNQEKSRILPEGRRRIVVTGEIKLEFSDPGEQSYSSRIDVNPDQADKRDYLGLSIDGGGIRGLMPAIWLNGLEEKVKDEIDQNLGLADVFDCMGGTSVGGILALGLAKPIPASDLVEIFRSRNTEVFPKSDVWYVPQFVSGWMATLKSLVARRYEHQSLEGLLREYFKDSQLKDAKTDLFITACGTDGHPIAFGREARYGDLRMWEIARCTSAAPTYFEAHRLVLEEGEKALVDGGIWANNPSPHVAAHLMKKFQANPSQVHLLSLGTGEVRAGQWIPDKTGAVTAAGPIIDALMTSHSRGNHIAMKNLFGNTYYRINSSLPSPITLDNTSDEAINLLTDLASEERSSIGKFFADNKDRMIKKLEIMN